MVLMSSAEPAHFLPFELIEDLIRRHAVQMLDRDMERGSPGEKRPGNANQMAMRIDQDIQSGR